MTEYVIETDELSKSYKDKAALRGLNLRVPAGSIFGFLGKNGAGKTTTIKTLMGLLHADSGSARVFGLPVGDADGAVAIRRRIGFVTEDKELYPYMTVAEIIRFTRGFFPAWRDDLERRYVDLFDLPLKRKIPELSKGMRSKLMLLLAFCRGADLLILDEPTDGLDPAAIEDVLREVVSIAAETGTTMFFSSHQLSEVDLVADHIGIIDGGRMVMSGSLDDIKASHQQLRVVLEEERQAPVRWGDGVESARQEGRVVTLLVSRNADAIAAEAQAIPGAVVERFPVTLKEIFLEQVRSH
ncbi:MAG TPA: ABC transporter ATP-binding protein [Edaphobacter sp.]